MDSRTGTIITAAQAQSGAYIWTVPNPLYFKITRHDQRSFNKDQDVITMQIQFNHNLRSQLGLHKCFLIFKIWSRLHPQTWRFLRVFRTQVMNYLHSLGVISINNVIRAVDHVLYNRLQGTMYVQTFHDIKYKIY
ncbi:AC3 protein [Eupatorium yellow vein virus-[Japan:Kagawa:Tomato:1997]]|uniref:Replication enhancer n=1 Tax=Eupatorium yellow vein virus-[Japan:Kagawa:Tomato:1997] TaxID=519350 RepID=B3Y570_9GEMI|nr:AC3 protein [Eupatorium yellow vein virus-[Japan:Kagawa:Tomato:1997]]BAG68477.1 AC3 protein [Eupatorium yellow vein virus-[Japan:Kagawa:Tomato:1997]]